MTSHNKHGHQRRNRRIHLATAAITGVVSGLTRALIDVLLHHLTIGG
ncbi:hypothetical protein [Micromonospora rubida]|nr:hypothetical protein [Micromonospora rubida]NBE85457.1 hypothetical protein [Micromonospora rubida]